MEDGGASSSSYVEGVRDIERKPEEEVFSFYRVQKLTSGWTVRMKANRMDDAIVGFRTSLEESLRENLQIWRENPANKMSDQDYEKFLKRVPNAASLFAHQYCFSSIENPGIVLNPPVEDLLLKVGYGWMDMNEYELALQALTNSIKMSKREGCAWPLRLCEKYSQLARAYMCLLKKQEQMKASIRSAALAASVKNSEDPTIFKMSMCDLMLQFADCSPTSELLSSFATHTLEQLWETLIGEKRFSYDNKLSSATPTAFTEGDHCFAMAEFFLKGTNTSFQNMLTLLGSSKSHISSLDGDIASKEAFNLLKVCGILVRFDDDERVEDICINDDFKNFSIELLKYATAPVPDNEVDEIPGPNMELGRKVASPFFRERYVQIPILASSNLTGRQLKCGAIFSNNIDGDHSDEPCFPGLAIRCTIHGQPQHRGTGPNAMGTKTVGRWHGENASAAVAEFQKQLKSREWNLKQEQTCKEFAEIGCRFGLWAVSQVATARFSFEEIEVALFTLNRMALELRTAHQVPIAQSMLESLVPQLLELRVPKLLEIRFQLAIEFVQNCHLTNSIEELIITCRHLIMVGRDSPSVGSSDLFLCQAHQMLALSYFNFKDVVPAVKELEKASVIVEKNKEFQWVNEITEAQEYLETVKALETIKDIEISDKRWKVREDTLEKLQASLDIVTGSRSINDGDVKHHDMYNWITRSLSVSEALVACAKLPEALKISSGAFEKAKELKFASLMAAAAWTCGNHSLLLSTPLTAAGFFREGIQLEADNFGSVRTRVLGNLHYGLGLALLAPGAAQDLPAAEQALRKAVDAYSQVIKEKTRSSEIRVLMFENCKNAYFTLQACLAARSEKCKDKELSGTKAIEALLFAERGRGRDMMLQMEQKLTKVSNYDSSQPNEPLTGPEDEAVDWEKFDADDKYAWKHLQLCMDRCTNAMKKDDPQIQRVTFVEYTVLRGQILIWVLHSMGTTAHDGSSLVKPPELIILNIREDEIVEDFLPDDMPSFRHQFDWMFGPSSAKRFLYSLQCQQDAEAYSTLERMVLGLRRRVTKSLDVNDLSSILISPIAHKLVPGQPVVFLPHEVLSFVPFVALRKEEEKQSKHLIEEHPIGTAFSLRALGMATQQYAAQMETRAVSSNQQMLLVGNPYPLVVKGPDYVSLEDAVKEVNAIASMLPPSVSSVLLKDQATFSNVIPAMRTAPWIHIAGHGQVNPQWPQGVLFLSYGKDELGAESICAPAEATGEAIVGNINLETRHKPSTMAVGEDIALKSNSLETHHQASPVPDGQDLAPKINSLKTHDRTSPSATTAERNSELHSRPSQSETTTERNSGAHNPPSPSPNTAQHNSKTHDQLSPSAATAEDNSYSGLLSSELIAKEVKSMNAMAVVLSSCKLGQGRQRGEGLMGFSREFMLAGVPVVIAALRTVESERGSAFMKHLYGKLLREKLSVMRSMQHTMIDAINNAIPSGGNESDGMISWGTWDWACWVVVGFPGVHFPQITI